MSSPLGRDLYFLALYLLNDEKSSEIAHKLEKEKGNFFNLSYFEELVMAGRWAEADSYLTRFTAIDHNGYSTKTFFMIRKQNYLEALDRHKKVKAVEILSRDLRVFESINQNLYRDMALLLALDDFRENVQLANYGDTNYERVVMFCQIKLLVEGNPFAQQAAVPQFVARKSLQSLELERNFV